MTPAVARIHRWVGLVAGLLILLAAGTAIALNHQDLWKRAGGAASSPYEKYVLALAADPAQPARLLAGTSDGLFRSEDGGKTWEEAVLPVPAEGACAIQFDPHRTGVVYVALRGIGVFRSTDHGSIWEEVELPFYPPEGTHVSGLSLGAGGGLILATTGGTYEQPGDGGPWRHEPRAPAAGADGGRRVAQLVYDLHDGRFWGQYGVLVTDTVSLALIGLVLTGYALFFLRLKRRRPLPRPLTVITSAKPRVGTL